MDGFLYLFIGYYIMQWLYWSGPFEIILCLCGPMNSNEFDTTYIVQSITVYRSLEADHNACM